MTVAFQGGIEFGWTQLPDDRIEYIIQLDDEAIEALKNGQPLTSSIPPEVSRAARIRIQYGAGVVSKPILSRKPQAFNAPRQFGSANSGNQGTSNLADRRPALQPNELNARFQDGGLARQVTTVQGNQATVSNSTLSGARPTAFVTQETGTNRALHWSNSNRVIGNIDNQNRTADSRSGFAGNTNTNNTAGAGTNSNLNNTNTGTGFGQGNGFSARPNTPDRMNGQGNVGQGNIGQGNIGQGNIGQGNIGQANNGQANNQANNGLTGAGQGATGQAGSNFAGQGSGFNANTNLNPITNRMAPVQNRTQNTGGWNSVNNPNRTNTAFPNAGSTAGSNGFNTGNVNNGNVNPNTLTNHGGLQGNYPNAGLNPATQYALNGHNGGFLQPGSSIPVSTPVSNSNDAALQKVQELQKQLDARDNEEKIAKIKADNDAKLEKANAMLNDLKKKIEKSESRKSETEAAVKPKKEESEKGSSSGIANVLLVISLGLNVFLVVQYLSVQNQFRDLSNDLRDTFMTNNYE